MHRIVHVRLLTAHLGLTDEEIEAAIAALEEGILLQVSPRDHDHVAVNPMPPLSWGEALKGVAVLAAASFAVYRAVKVSHCVPRGS